MLFGYNSMVWTENWINSEVIAELIIMFLVIPVSFVALIVIFAMIANGDLKKSDLLIIPFVLFIVISISHFADGYFL